MYVYTYEIEIKHQILALFNLMGTISTIKQSINDIMSNPIFNRQNCVSFFVKILQQF